MFNNPRRIESRNIFKYSCVIGISMLLLIALMYICSFLISSVLFLRGFSPNQLDYFIKNDVISSLSIQAVSSIIVLTVPFIFGAKILNFKISDIISFNFPSSKKLLSLNVFFSLGVAVLANFLVSIMIVFLEVYFGFEVTQPEILEQKYNNVFELFFALIVIAVIPALVEEFAFRGVVLGALRKFGDIPAIIISSLLFAFIHGNFVQIPFAFIMGLGLAIAVVVTKSIWSAIIIHFINNSLSVFSNYFSENSIVLIFGFLFISGIVSFAILINKGYLKFNKVPSCFSQGERTVKLFLSPTIILAIIYFIYASLEFIQ